MKFFKKTFFPKFISHGQQICARTQPTYEPFQRLASPARQQSISVVRQHVLKKKELSVMVNLLIEIGDLMNKLERRLYCFLTELERTKTNPRKYKSLLELYKQLAPDLTDIMTSYQQFFSTGKKSFSDPQVFAFYQKILRNLKNIGTHLLQFTLKKQNLQSLNYRYKYPQNTPVSKCYLKTYPQVIDLMKKGKPNAQVNQRKYEMISKCVRKQQIQSDCVQLYDEAVASGSRDVFIMQAFMRIKLLMDTIRKERRKMMFDLPIIQQIQQQQKHVDQTIFTPLKQATSGQAQLSRKQVVLKNRSCVSQQTQKQTKQQQKQKQTKQQQLFQDLTVDNIKNNNIRNNNNKPQEQLFQDLTVDQ